jgi:hypothetical protein
MKICPNCGNALIYNNRYHCYECTNISSCNKVFNAFLQELRPIEEWKYEYDYENDGED